MRIYTLLIIDIFVEENVNKNTKWKTLFFRMRQN